ncbi:uncharacterized protein LOC134278838 [Saccostrea cucullata]|uniref:uncharacterized protein LOC134278838 n=1 Tax=Saccostrea cuccullata TaxID=36930 RepID=UPI002ED556DE
MSSIKQHEKELKMDTQKTLSAVELCEVLLIAGKQALMFILQNEIEEPLVGFFARHKHELFHLYIQQKCCGCHYTKTTATKYAVPRMSFKDWSSLFVPNRKKCLFKGYCFCQFELSKGINLHFLGIPLLTCVLLNICNLPEDEKLKVLHYQEVLRAVIDYWENFCDCNTFHSAEKVVLGMVTREDNLTLIKKQIRELKSNPSLYFDEVKKYMMDFLEEKRRTADSTELLISSMAGKHGFRYITQFERKMKRSQSLPYGFSDFRIGTELEETQEHQRCSRFYPLENFPHFQYVYSLVYDCYCHLKEFDNIIPDEWAICFLKPGQDLVIKVDFIGTLTQERLNLVSDIKGKEERNGKTVWSESPLICFHEDVKGHNRKACHTLIVKKELKDTKKIQTDTLFHMTEYDEEEVRKKISVCLEKGLGDYLKRTMNKIKYLEHNANEDLEDLYLEMETILKHIMHEENILQHIPKENDNCGIPSEIKDLLFREPYVNSFGIWEDKTFKVYMDEIVDTDIFIEKLKRKNKTFFENFKILVEKKKFTTKIATKLKQGGEIHRHTPSEDGVECGTLGGFVKDTRTTRNCCEAYALTCNHLYPTMNDPAFATINGEEREIGKCIFSTRENFCDFAVVEINKELANQCDLEFRRDDEMTCNAEVSDCFPINVGIVHKNGSRTNWTRGRIVSREFCDVLNKKEGFVVKGSFGRPFSAPGDSGSIVFARDNSVAQNTVDVLGMVYSNNLEIRENFENPESGQGKTLDVSQYLDKSPKKSFNEAESKYEDVNKSKIDNLQEEKSKSRKNPENYSLCFRMNNAFELLKNEKKLVVGFEKVHSSTETDNS